MVPTCSADAIASFPNNLPVFRGIGTQKRPLAGVQGYRIARSGLEEKASARGDATKKYASHKPRRDPTAKELGWE